IILRITALKQISIISVNYGQAKLTAQFIESVRASTHPLLTELIVIDNGSVQNPVPEWESLFPDTIFIRSEQNLVFAGGNNLGIRVAKGKFIFLVNNDTIFNPELVPSLLKVFESHPRAGMVCPLILDASQPVLQYAGFTPMNWFTGRNACLGKGETDQKQFGEQVYHTAYPHGAAMMLTKKTIGEVG